MKIYVVTNCVGCVDCVRIPVNKLIVRIKLFNVSLFLHSHEGSSQFNYVFASKPLLKTVTIYLMPNTALSGRSVNLQAPLHITRQNITKHDTNYLQ